MEKRSLFNMIFGKKEKEVPVKSENFKIMDGYTASYTKASNKVTDNIIVKECIHAIATHCAKMIPRHYQIKGEIKEKIDGDINYILSVKPNPYMTTYDFIYKIMSLLLGHNNEWIYKDIDKDGYLRALYPLNPSFCTLVESNNEIWIKFQFLDGNIYYIKYTNIIHLRNFYINHDFYGDSNDILKNSVETQVVTDDGIKNAIKISASLRGIIRANETTLKNKDVSKMRDDFIDSLFKSTRGIGALDNRMEFKELNLNPIILDKEQLEAVNNNIYSYFMVSEKVVRSDFTSEEWDAFYESVLEPRAIQLGQAFTNGIFNEKAIKAGHRIEFSVNRIKYAKADTKIKLLKEVGVLGMLTVDEGREILDLPAIGGEEGKQRLQTLNVIDTKIAKNYQGGGADE